MVECFEQEQKLIWREAEDSQPKMFSLLFYLIYLFLFLWHIVLKCLKCKKKKMVMFSVKASLTCRPVRFVTVSHYASARGLPKAAVAVAWLPAKLTHIANLCQIHYNISRVLIFFWLSSVCVSISIIANWSAVMTSIETRVLAILL